MPLYTKRVEKKLFTKSLIFQKNYGIFIENIWTFLDKRKPNPGDVMNQNGTKAGSFYSTKTLELINLSGNEKK